MTQSEVVLGDDDDYEDDPPKHDCDEKWWWCMIMIKMNVYKVLIQLMSGINQHDQQ
jgi:hypothetical protein